MEKLLNLLNEYECYRNGYDICTGWQERNGRIVWVTDDPRPQVRSEYYILSKEFGFIQWLVENDKIDRDKIIINSDFMPVAFDRKGEKYEWSEEKQLLMLLAISDTPIDFLCEIIKN